MEDAAIEPIAVVEEQQTKLPAPSKGSAATTSLVILAVLGVGLAVTALGPILKPLFIAVFLFFATKPAADALVRWRFPRWLAYLTLFLLASASICLVMVFVYSEVKEFQASWPRYEAKIAGLFERLPSREGRPIAEIVQFSSRDVLAFVFESSVATAETLVMTFFYFLFLLIGARKFPERIRRAYAPAKAEKIIRVSNEIGGGMERFMRAKTIASLGMGATSAVLMWLFGLDHWALWSFFFFALNYITYIGSIAACVPPIAFAYLDLEPIPASFLAGLLIFNRFIWVDYIEIRLSGRSLNTDSVVLFVWLSYWGWVWGLIGLILAFPMVACLKLVLEYVDGAKSFAILMSED
jgi:AI-2 transport protein TqsA